MIIIDNDVLEDFKEHCKQSFPHEAVGILKGGKYVPLKNSSENPTENFFLSNSDIIEEDDVTALLHSHTDGSVRPSYEDMKTQISIGIPMGIMGVYNDYENNAFNFTRIEWLGVFKNDYLGLPYIFGINDCYSLVRNWFYKHKKIELMDFPRRWEFWNIENIFLNNLALAGFKEITINEAEPGDVFLCTFHNIAHIPIHCGVLVEDDMIEHHTSLMRPVNYSMKSVREPAHRYLSSMSHFARYVKNV